MTLDELESIKKALTDDCRDCNCYDCFDERERVREIIEREIKLKIMDSRK